MACWRGVLQKSVKISNNFTNSCTDSTNFEWVSTRELRTCDFGRFRPKGAMRLFLVIRKLVKLIERLDHAKLFIKKSKISTGQSWWIHRFKNVLVFYQQNADDHSSLKYNYLKSRSMLFQVKSLETHHYAWSQKM